MRMFSAVTAIALSVLAGRTAMAQTVFCQWDFDAIGPVGPVDENTGLPTDAPYFTSGLIYNTPSPTIGNGSCIPLGMDNLDSGPPNHTGTYVFGPYGGQLVYGTVAYCDVSPQSGLAHGGSTYSITCWRVRGPNNTYVAPGINNGNGWNRSAPQKSQGAQFSTSTVGYTNVKFQCQISCSTQSVSCMQPQYTIDGTNWLDFGAPVYMASNDFIQPPSGLISATNYGVNLDFSSTAGVNNNANFGVRIVSIYDPRYLGTAQVPAPQYAAASAPTTTPYNNSSGNWRFGLMTFTGTASGPINPFLRASTDKIAACGSDDNTIKFQALVQPGVNPPSTGTTVYADLSSLGLSNHQLLTGNPSGTFFVYTGTIPANTVVVPPGQTTPITRSVTLTVTDDQMRSVSSSTSISFVNCNAVDSGAPVVISQVYGGGGNTDSLNAANQGVYDSDFVEIYNRSAAAVNLNGWSVQYASPASSGGFNNSNNEVLLSGMILPQQYMLVRFSDPVYGFQPLPAPDFATKYGYGGIGNTGGRVALSSSASLIGTSYTAATVKDLVGFGSAAVTFEGAGPAPTPDNAHAVIRKSTGTDPHAGSQDSNQNFNDFVSGTPTPHNRASNGTATFLTAYASIPSNDVNKVVVTNSACAGSAVLFTVAVTPGSTSTGIAVSGDVSAITGSPGTITLNDSGASGDVGANDGVYSFLYTIPANAAQGFRTVTFTASDAQGGVATSSLVLAIGTCTDSGAPVVISKLFGGGAHYDYVPNMDFAEIYNRSSAPVDLTGWNVQYQDSDNDFSAAKSIPLSGMIGPGERRLIAPQPVPGIGLSIPTPDFAAALPGFGFDNHFGRLALVKPIAPATTAATLVATGAGSGVMDARGLVDLLGYGSTDPTYEGVSPTDTLSNGTWLQRKNNGNQDFNQNLIDFDVAYILSLPSSTRTVTVVKHTPGLSSGTVMSDFGEINCGATCTAVLNRDSMVNLTATPGANSRFIGWSGGCSGTGACFVTLSDSVSVTAEFRCKADYNNDGMLAVQDIFDFLNGWFAGNPAADFNGGGLSVQDIFDFLNEWFSGC
jgi:hypothetical protein